MRHTNKPLALIVSLFIMVLTSSAMAGVSMQEAQRLKSDLTPQGAERAGNKDGSIPEWTGGIAATPAGSSYHPGNRYADIFKDDKILFSITSANMDQYADLLIPGQKAMFKRFPDTYRIDVYPTRRSHAAPEWVYENTYQNATRASLTQDGLGIVNAYGGTPFPIPKNGEQAIFNHILRYAGASRIGPYFNAVVKGDGSYATGAGGQDYEQYPYYFRKGNWENFSGDIYNIFIEYSRPKRMSGELLLVKDPLNQSEDKRKAWQYLPGQRRVRRAPTIAFDTPQPGYGGIFVYDDTFMFNGSLERYDWKLAGKKEIFVPYNCYKFHNADTKDLFLPGHANPDVLRWERHRVWVVEATLKEDRRHVYKKRVFYLDEDSWCILLKDQYDGRDNLWRTAVGTTWNHYNVPGTILVSIIMYDMTKSLYAVEAVLNEDKEYLVISPEDGLDSKYFTPEYLRKRGRR